ncbi:MAG TPA: helix-turn-helix transcriptional regulator [Planctomycetota bacterium]|nr:helix-turn-helix transcriptional regulator [Planctomycetota bacterium]
MDANGWRRVPEVRPQQLAPSPIFASYWIAPSHLKIPVFQLTGIQTMLILEGDVKFRSWDPEGRLWTGRIGPGDLFSFFPGRLQYERTANQVVRWYQTMYFVAAGELQGGVPFIEGVGRMPQLVNVGDEVPAFCARFDRLIAALHFQRPTWPIETAAALLDLIQGAFVCAGRSGSVQPRRVDFWDSLLVRLEEDSKTSVRALAKECRMSVNHFIRQFRQHVGTTPKQYLLTRRLWKAREHLRTGAMVKEAARKAGFDDPLHFSRQYRKLFGEPPSTQQGGGAAGAGLLASSGLPVGRHIWAPGYGMHAIPMLGPAPSET